MLAGLLTEGRACLAEPILAELLVGARGERERGVLLDLGASAPVLALDRPTWVAAGDLGHAWRTRGRTLSLVDCLIAALARREGLPVWTLDADFEPLAEGGELRLYAP